MAKELSLLHHIDCDPAACGKVGGDQLSAVAML